MASTLNTFWRGEAYSILVSVAQDGTPVNFAATPCYLLLVNAVTGYRLTLKYVPGDVDNDGAFETPKVAFRFAAEATRAADYLPAGNYTVHVHVGPITGLSNFGVPVARLPVSDLTDGQPVTGAA